MRESVLNIIMTVIALVVLTGCSGDKAQRLQQLEQLEQQNRSGEAMLNDSLAEDLVTIEDCKKFNARTAIGKTKMEDIKKWRADNLLPNPSIKRMNVLKKVS